MWKNSVFDRNSGFLGCWSMTKFIKLYSCIHILYLNEMDPSWKKVQSFVWNLMRVRPKVSNKGPYCQSYGFSSSHIWRWELDHKKGWVPKNWWFWIKVLEKTLESPLDSKDIKPDNPKGNQILSIHWKDWCWSWSSNTLSTWCEELTHWERPWCWERLRAGWEEDGREWDG